MKVTKYLHSCLLIEHNNRTVLTDPGIFTYELHVFPFDKIEKIDVLTITHEHPDHMHIPFIKELLLKYPDIKIIANKSIVDLLAQQNIKSSEKGCEEIMITPAQHERVFDNEVPMNTVIDVFDQLTHPGDSLSFLTTKAILAIPILGPSWMITQAAERAAALQPKVVLPIHDWHLRDEIRKTFYSRMQEYLKQKNIIFIPLETEKQQNYNRLNVYIIFFS